MDKTGMDFEKWPVREPLMSITQIDEDGEITVRQEEAVVWLGVEPDEEDYCMYYNSETETFAVVQPPSELIARLQEDDWVVMQSTDFTNHRHLLNRLIEGDVTQDELQRHF